MSILKNSLWYRWLLIVTGGLFLFSLSFIVLPAPVQQFFNWMVSSTINIPVTLNSEGIHYVTFVYGVLGAVMVGWSIMLASMLLTSFQRGERSAWWAIAASICVWFILDSAFSLSMGFWQNALFNVVFFVLYTVPLAATYAHFNRQRG